MTSSEYWETRIQRIFDKRQKEMAVEELYRGVYRRFHSEVKQLYEELGKRDLKRSELYRAAKFLAFRRQLQERLTDVSGSMEDKMSRELVRAYKDAGLAAKESIGAKSVWTVQNRKMAEACINRKWAGDSFSGRIWKNRNQLAKTVEKGICDIIITGRGRSELLRELNKTDYRKRFTTPEDAAQEEAEAQLEAYLQRGRRRADCLVRTELMHTINTAQIETYRSEGVNYLAFECEPTACPECMAIAAGNPYPIDKIPCTIGHPRCRCTWLAVEDEDVPEMLRKRDSTQADFRGKKLKTVDKSAKRDIIKSGGGAMALENQRYGRNKDTLVNKTYIDGGEYRRKFDKISDKQIVNRTIYNAAKEALKHRSGTELEDMYWVDGNTGKVIAKEIDSNQAQSIYYSDATKKAIAEYKGGNIIAIHTHPSSMPPSAADFNSCFRNGYKRGYVACHDGKLYEYKANQEINERLYNLYIEDYINDGFDEFDAQILALKQLMKNCNIDFWEVK
ncbi:MAG: hypothetical protein Q4G33_10040 [bacterium]|nr:hypothetical protein [bacterium]